MLYIPRLQENRLKALLKRFPVVCLTGPRQAGKSTLLKHLQEPSWGYVTFDQRATLELALNDPDLFVRELKTPAIIDEAQKGATLFHSIKAEVDQNPLRRFILSGSANFQLMQNITETLAGRAAILELYPFSIGEMLHLKTPQFLPYLLKTRSLKELQSLVEGISIKPLKNLYYYILWGGLPKIYEFKKPEERVEWFENYRTTYIERDLRNLAQVGNLEDFQKFYRSLAFQTGQRLNLSELSKEMGISVPTCKRYLDILRTSYQAEILPAYYLNIQKRLAKTPKAYLLDSGLSSFFLRYGSEEMLRSSGRFGALFETWVFGEMKKVYSTLTLPPTFHYWHPHAGFEVDFVLEAGEFLYPIEVKYAIRLQKNDWRGIEDFIKTIQRKKIPFGLIFYRGDKVQTVAPKILALPLEYLWH